MVGGDAEAILLKVEQRGGAACHTGYASCFYRRLDRGFVEVVGRKIFDPEDVYRK